MSATDEAAYLKKQVSGDVIGNVVINGGIHYLIAAPFAVIPITNGWTDFDPSFFGFIGPLAVLLSGIQTFIAYWLTIRRRKAGKVGTQPAADISWRGRALRIVAQHAGLAALVVVPLAFAADTLWPGVTMNSLLAVAIVATLAGVIAGVVSTRAVKEAYHLA